MTETTKYRTVPIKGMHCKSCEIVTEEELAPAALPSLVQRLLREGPPPEPFDAGI